MSLPKLIEINREVDIDPKNILKIDGIEIKGIQNVKIEYGIDNPHPVVTIQILAKGIAGRIKATKISIKKGKRPRVRIPKQVDPKMIQKA